VERGLGDEPWGWMINATGTEDKGPFDHPIAAAIKAHNARALDGLADDHLFHPVTGEPDQTTLGSWAVAMGDRRDIACYSPARRTWVRATHMGADEESSPPSSEVAAADASDADTGASRNEGSPSRASPAVAPPASWWRLYTRTDAEELLGLTAADLSGGKSPLGLAGYGKGLALTPWLMGALGPEHARSGVERPRKGAGKGATARGARGVGGVARGAAAVLSKFRPGRPYLDLSPSAVLFFYCGLHRILRGTYAPPAGGAAGEAPDDAAAAAAAAATAAPLLFAATEAEFAAAAGRVAALLPIGGAAAGLVEALLADRLALVSLGLPGPLAAPGGIARTAPPEAQTRAQQQAQQHQHQHQQQAQGAPSSFSSSSSAATAAATVSLHFPGGTGPAPSPLPSLSPAAADRVKRAMQWAPGGAFEATLALGGGGEEAVVAVAGGEDLQTAAARFCRRYGITDASARPGAPPGHAECWRLVDHLSAERPPFLRPGTPAAAAAMASAPAPLARLSSPVKGAVLGGAGSAAAQVAIKATSAAGGFCCVYINDGLASAWCGPVEPQPGAGAVVVGGVDRASLGGGGGPHALLLVCRPSRDALEAEVRSAPQLRPDDAAFFSFAPEA